MAEHLKIIAIEKATHDVLHITTEKPENINYNAGQAADISINKPKWENELRAFTFTSLPTDKQLEFTIKTYPQHNGVTNQLLSLKPGDELLLHGVFGTIGYKGEGIFIAGGAGITPFIAIYKQLEKEGNVGNNKLLFANKTRADIIQEKKFKDLLGKYFINILSEEKLEGFEYGYITEGLLRQYLDATGYIYLCGPEPMMVAVEKHLNKLNVDSARIVKEVF
ncbi:MAG TPA: FAD-binding oxidoreductase [Bacteroidia bacterium]|nr:flavodoxin reductase [Bacteroidia bacterium]QQR95594.1 MAG: flavodoxin reductase [Bacteroidota bacterium]MBP7714917.1 flavodoxin reductase [Bacteroidia bacterium]MBP8668267.1 flavodoxin reductase [Bacteroidia bacterium]HOZ81874.1 FAD-binding oxidoreductase [Bacteroidia bacterium]